MRGAPRTLSAPADERPRVQSSGWGPKAFFPIRPDGGLCQVSRRSHGNVVTDWWMRMAEDPHFPALRDSAYRVRAQVDVLMPGSEVHFGTTREDAIMDSYGKDGGITLGEMQRTAMNVLRYLLRVGWQGARA